MPRRSFISALLYTIRPFACFGIAIFATAGLGRWDDLFVATVTFFAAFMGGAGGFLINYISDRERDLKNSKGRSIAAGEIPVRTAFILSVICCLTMLLLSFFLSFNSLILAVLLIAMFWSYSYFNQRFVLLSSIWVSICTGLAFLFGALVYELTPVIYLAMFLTLFVNVGREILLGSTDRTGRYAVGRPSIRLLYGEKRTKVIVALFFALGSVSLLVFLLYFPAVWPWMGALLLLLWVPFFVKSRDAFRKWSLYNVRISFFFFAVLIVFLFTRPDKQAIATHAITSDYCLDMLENLQSKGDDFYPKGIFPSQRNWLFKKGSEDNNVFSTASIAYILRSTQERSPNIRALKMINHSISSFEKYRNRVGQPTYNFYLTEGDHFPNSIILSQKRFRVPDDYDCTALIQLARGSHPLDQSVRSKMLTYAMRPNRKTQNNFPSKHGSKKVYEVWYADKMQQELDIVVMANVLLFVTEKKYSPETPDQHTIKCLKAAIDEEWYFKNPNGFGYSPHYNRSAIILYFLTRLVAKDFTGEFAAQRAVLISHLRQAMDQSDQTIEKAMVATSLLRLGESVNLSLNIDQVISDTQSFVFFSHSPSLTLDTSPALHWQWRSEAVSWALLYELLSFGPAVHWQ